MEKLGKNNILIFKISHRLIEIIFFLNLKLQKRLIAENWVFDDICSKQGKF